MISDLKKKRLVRIYKITLPILALISVFTLMSLGSNFFKYSLQPKFIFLLNHLIWIVFTADFFVRMHLIDNRKHFLTRHLAELIAIVPVFPFILLAKLLGDLHMTEAAAVIFEIVFIIKFFSYLIRAFVTQHRFIRTNPLHYAAAVTMTALVVAAMLFSGFEGRNYSDSIWWAFSTASTTGFGDIVPLTPEGRLVGMFLMVVGLACISMLTGVIAGMMMYSNNLTRPESSVVIGIIKALSRFSELSESDVDEICAVLKTLKKRHSMTAVKADHGQRETLEDNIIDKAQKRKGSIAKWINDTFISDPHEDAIIEKRLSEGKNPKD
ncbi:MAG: ion channel [Synergistota bacterium]|nr:ion channel [Synergistota bacterium]